MSAWIESNEQEVKNIEKSFEDNFVGNESENTEFKKLDDSEQYLKILGTKQHYLIY